MKLFILCSPHNQLVECGLRTNLTNLQTYASETIYGLSPDEIHCDLLRAGKKHIPMGKIMPDNDKLITAMAVSKSLTWLDL